MIINKISGGFASPTLQSRGAIAPTAPMLSAPARVQYSHSARFLDGRTSILVHLFHLSCYNYDWFYHAVNYYIIECQKNL